MRANNKCAALKCPTFRYTNRNMQFRGKKNMNLGTSLNKPFAFCLMVHSGISWQVSSWCLLSCYPHTWSMRSSYGGCFLSILTSKASPQMGPSSERSAQSTLPLQILSGVRQTEVSLAQGYLGGLQAADSHDSSSEWSSQSMSPSHTQLFVMHLPVEEMERYWTF